MTHTLVPAALDDAAIAEIKSLEKEMDTVLVALKPVPTPSPAELSPADLDKLRQAEQRLGVVMVAYGS